MELLLVGYTVIFNGLPDKWALFISGAWGGSPLRLHFELSSSYHVHGSSSDGMRGEVTFMQKKVRDL